MASTTFSGPVTSTNGFIGALTGAVTGTVTGAVLATTPVNVTDSTVTITQALHAGAVVTLNRAAGIVVTLPAATGTGSVYTFVVGTAVTTPSDIIKVANVTDVINGLANVISDDAAAMLGFVAAATDDTITLNGTTTGGLLGNKVVIIDVASGKFHAMVNTSATGSEATPFSATVNP